MNNDELLKLDNQVCFALYAANRAMTKMYKPLLDPFNLTYPQYLVMLVLFEKSGISVNELGEKLYLDSGTLTPLLKRMEQSNLIKRTRSKVDERRVIIELTKFGSNLKVDLATVPLSLCDTYECEPTKMSELRETLKSLVKILHQT
jgi:DNA-binding MarR family transcriptional regulator